MLISIKDPREDELFPELKRIGYDGIDVKLSVWENRELILSREFEASIMEKYQRAYDAGLKVCQTHLTYYPGHLPPLGDGSYEAFEEYMLPIFVRGIELTAKMNCGVAVIHLYFEESKEKSRAGNLKLIEKLLPVLKKNNVILAMENIYGPKYGEANLSCAEDMLYYTEHFKSEHLGVCLDTGHAVTRGQDPVDMLIKLGSSVKALHVHSNFKGADLHLPPTMINNVDFKKFCEVLREIGFTGAFNMEISPPKTMDPNTRILFYAMSNGIAKGLLGE